MMQVAPLSSVAPQGVAEAGIANCVALALRLMLLIVRATPPVFDSVMDCGPAVVFSKTLPKLSAAGATPMTGLPARTVAVLEYPEATVIVGMELPPGDRVNPES